MSKHNYSQYSKKPAVPVDEVIEQVAVVDEVVVPEVESVTTVAAPVEPVEIKMATEHREDVPKVEPKPVVHKPVVGVVFNCSKLNVREKPEASADIVCVLDGGSEVEIDMSRSASDWYKVCTAAGVDGFCMRKFVKR